MELTSLMLLQPAPPAVASGMRAPAGLEDLIAANLEDNDDMGEDPDTRQDPIAAINILEYVAEQLRAFSAAHSEQFNTCCFQLGPERLKPLTYLFPSA